MTSSATRMKLYSLIIFTILSTIIISVKSSEENIKLSRQRGIERNLTTLLAGSSEINKNKENGNLLHEASSSQTPSITSVHQVWTSTSSGRMDELSPEVIGKLRNDVPFLAAYALRPRLVGAITSHPSGAIQPLESYINQAPRDSSLASQASDASERRVSLIPSLGDFSEFKVETSSTSKSEHHHKRKSSLKRKPKEEEEMIRLNGELRSRKRVLQTANRLLKRRRDERSGIKTKGKKIQKANLLRRKLNEGNLIHHMSIIKHGRYIQAADNDDDVKGGSKVTKGDSNKRPFYDSHHTVKDDELDRPDSSKKAGVDDDDKESDVKVDEHEKNVETDDETDNEDDELEPPPTAKRVGDDDVEEDGDTVTVMPKSDGVDDDPELPDYEEAESSQGGNDEERGKRVDRERPNRERENGVEKDDDDNSDRQGGGSVLGGGLGATTGGGSVGSDDNESERGAKDEDASPKERSGVEFADPPESDDDNQNASPKVNHHSSKPSSRKNEQPNLRDEDDFKSDREESGGRGGKGSSVDSEEGSDMMRRKTTNSGDSSGSKDDSSHSSAGKEDSDSSKKSDGSNEGDLDYQDELDQAKRERGKGAKDSHKKKSSNCDDGSYDHHDHHDHHNSIKWLEDAIPGKAGFDYPIASRINSTSFNCREQKYPGYYADVESRCQVFHICQADGRQDSFLCPNGTIFSQKTTVCVWWNSFDCEDAPKYYDLNALLYKTPITTSTGRETLNELRPRDRSDSESSIDSLIQAMRRRSNEDDMKRVLISDEGSRIDGYDKSTSITDVRNAQPRTKMLMDDIGAEDEASIQRKSTALSEDETAGLNEARSSRLRRLNSGPRRKRRASTRQAPPKLKSRRVSRNSRRWKLRHGIKPKRRA